MSLTNRHIEHIKLEATFIEISKKIEKSQQNLLSIESFSISTIPNQLIIIIS